MIKQEQNMKSHLIGTLMIASMVSAESNVAEWLRNQNIESGTTLTLPEGIHHARPNDFPYRHLHISNNDDGIKHIVFDLSGLENVTIDGNGAELVMHGHIIPFFMEKAKNITIKNLTIDWAHPFYAQGEVVDAGESWFEVRFEEDYNIRIKDGQLVAVNPDLQYPAHLHNVNFIDPVKGEQAYRSTDDYGMFKPGNQTVTRKADGVFRIASSLMRNKPQAGQVAVFQYAGRTSPAIAVHNSSNIRIENVTQYHAAAIANIFEGSENIYIDRMTMKRRGNRWYSALNDATHHVDCRGDLFITNSHFEFQGDDAANIHGIYRTVDGSTDENGLRLRLNHHQQLGVDTIHPGDTIALCDRDSLETLAKLKVGRVVPHDHQITNYFFENPLPDLDWRDVVAMAYITNVNVNISGNTFQNNRARGVLVKTYGKIRIHDNYFHTPGPAVITGYGTRGKWFESGPFNDLEITRNTIDQCMFGDWGRALFSMGTGQGKPTSKNARIHNNKIIQIYKPLVSVNNVENFSFYDNEIVKGTDYPHWEKSSENVQIGNGVTIRNEE